MVKPRGISIRAAPAGKVAQPAVAGIKHQPLILTYNDRTVTHLHIKWGVAVGPPSSELVLDICPLPGYTPP